jgi:hypothetical protein
LHIEQQTPDFYVWTSRSRWAPAGTPVLHGGLATGAKSGWGRLGTSIPPEKQFSGYRTFKIDIPLQPGDSGGPVVDAYGRLVGINSAVEFLVPMETAFFIDSEGKRPHLGDLERVIAEDRLRKRPWWACVEGEDMVREIRHTIFGAERLLLCLVLSCLFAGCAEFEESGLPGSAASMAHNQIMYVSKEPESFGYYRLSTLADGYSDLEFFLRKRGDPDFLAETSNGGRHYMIVYYLRDRQAYASRPRIGSRRSLEFAGPYPITPKEVVILDKLRKRHPHTQGTRWGGVKREGAPEE